MPKKRRDPTIRIFMQLPLEWYGEAKRPLSAAEKGYLIELAEYQWLVGALPDDDVQLAHIAGAPPRVWGQRIGRYLRSLMTATPAGLVFAAVNERREHALEVATARSAASQARPAVRARQTSADAAETTPEEPRAAGSSDNLDRLARVPHILGQNAQPVDIAIGRDSNRSANGATQVPVLMSQSTEEEKKEGRKEDSKTPAERTREREAPMPRLSDPPEKWLHLADTSERPANDMRPHPLVKGYYLNQIAQLVCQAAKINDANWRGDWTPIREWLEMGYDPHKHIVPAIKERAGQRGYRGIRSSLRYFDQAIAEYAARVEAA